MLVNSSKFDLQLMWTLLPITKKPGMVTIYLKRTKEFIKRQPKQFKINIVRASANNFLVNLTRQFQSIYFLSLNATTFQLGLVSSIAGFLATILAIPTGWIADRKGIRNMFLAGTPLWIISSLIFSLAYDWTMAIPAMIIAMLASQFFYTACPMVCGSYLKNEERATGKQFCETFSGISILVAPIIASVIISNFGGLSSEGIRPLYLIETVGFLLIFVFVYKLYFDKPQKEANPKAKTFVGDINEVFKSGRAVKPWIVFIFLSNITFFTNMAYLPVFITEIKLGDEFVLGSISSAYMVLPLLLSIIMGRCADTFGRKRVLYLTMPLYCTSLLILIFAKNPIWLLIFGILSGFFQLSFITQGAITAELVNISLLGRWYGILNFSRGLASIIAPLIGGFIWTFLNPSSVFFFILITEILRFLILLLLIPETLRKKKMKSETQRRVA